MKLMIPEDFDPWVGRKVRVNTVPRPVEILLTRVERRPALTPSLDFRQPFSIFFESAQDVYLLDDTYEVDCGRGGPYALFLSQLPPRSGIRHYQAVFA
jgi:hypothetical protein